MPRPVAYKTGTIQPPNTAKQSNILVGVGPSNWGAGAANATFYNGLDSSYQYVIIKNSNPPAMWGTGDFTTGSLLTTINGLPDRVGQTRFTDTSTAISWSLASGEYTILRNEELFGDNGLVVSLKPKSINRIPNGNFNGPSIYGGDRYPFYFDYGSPSPVVVDISNDKPYVGSNSTRAMKLFAGGGMWAGIGGKLGLEVGKQYILSWWYKQNNSNNYNFNWQNQGGSGDMNFYATAPTATTNWSKSFITFTHVIDKYYFFLVSAGSQAGSELLMTEIQLEEGSTATNFKPFNDYDYPTNRGIGTGSLTLTNMAGYQSWAWNGKYGGGYNFDGIDDRITYPIGYSTWNDKTFTIESWFEWGTGGSNANYGWFELAGAGGSNWGLSHVPRTGAFYFYWVSSANGGGYYVLNNAIQDNVPLHMAITFNGVGGNNAATLYNNTKIYINGVLQTNIEGGGAGVGSNSSINIGGQTYPFKGNIYTFNYYNRVLSDTEIENLYNVGVPTYLPSQSIVNQGLVLYLDASNPNSYPGSGTTWTDISGYGNDFTLVNSPTFNTGNGGYLQFDGVDDYAYLAVNSSISVGLACSLEMVVKNDYAMRMGQGGGYWAYGFEGAGFAHTSGPQGNISPYFDGNSFHHYVFIWNQAQNNHTMYKDGVPVYSFSPTYSFTAGGGGYFVLGGARGNNGFQSYGSPHIAMLRLYNKVLTGTEVQQNFNSIKTQFGL